LSNNLSVNSSRHLWKSKTHSFVPLQVSTLSPVLPLISVANMDEAVHFINKGEKPLALYVFTNNLRKFQKIIDRTSSGGVLCNDTLIHSSCKQ